MHIPRKHRAKLSTTCTVLRTNGAIECHWWALAIRIPRSGFTAKFPVKRSPQRGTTWIFRNQHPLIEKILSLVSPGQTRTPAILIRTIVTETTEWTFYQKAAPILRLPLPLWENLCLFQNGHPCSFGFNNPVAIGNSIKGTRSDIPGKKVNPLLSPPF